MYEILKSTEIKRLIADMIGATTLESWVGRIAMGPVGSNSASETYAGLQVPPVMRKWLSGRSPKELREDSITIVNDEYEASIIIPKRFMRRDKIGAIDPIIQGLADRSVQHWRSLIATLIVNAQSTNCYDGQYFFDTDHPIGDTGSTQSNDISADISTYPVVKAGTTTNPSVEEASFALLDGINQILSLKDGEGEPMNEDVSDFVVVCPLSLRAALAAAVGGAPASTSGAPEALRALGTNIQVVGTPRLSSWITKFAVFAADVPNRPFIMQEEPEAEEVNVKAEGSDFEFDHNAHQYGVSASRGVGYGAPQSACLVTLV